MIEGGNAGGSALAQASQRRATADRLIHEAKWLEAVASDERLMAAQLANLPETYTILHDLRVPGSKGNIDHVVIGPGGAFLIVTRRHDDGVQFHDQQLWAGPTSLKNDFDASRQEAQILSQTLGTPVVPVIGLLGAPVPVAVPSAIDGVMVCALENVDRVVTRNAHTLLPTPKIAEAAERALPLLNTPGSTPRVLLTEAAKRQIAAAAAPPVPAAMSIAPAMGAGTASAAAGVAAGAKPTAKAQKSAAAAQQQEKRRTGFGLGKLKERTGGKKSAAFVVALIGSLCLVAFAVGSLVRVLWTNDDSGAAAAATSTVLGDPTTTIFIAAPSTVAPAPTAAVAPIPAPAVGFTPVCPGAGAGWQLVPAWPGDVANLANYVVETQGADGTWVPGGSFATADAVAGAAINGQGPSATLMVQFVAVLTDGSRSPATPTAVITPATAC
jgi:hypothetical protein